jgi:NAD-dependent dihydropyrimidine dehydrogenase PreA subunit
MPPVFDDTKCIRCGECVRDCPAYILKIDDERGETPQVIEEYKLECWHCGNCRISCPSEAVSFEFPLYTLV